MAASQRDGGRRTATLEPERPQVRIGGARTAWGIRGSPATVRPPEARLLERLPAPVKSAIEHRSRLQAHRAADEVAARAGVRILPSASFGSHSTPNLPLAPPRSTSSAHAAPAPAPAAQLPRKLRDWLEARCAALLLEDRPEDAMALVRETMMRFAASGQPAGSGLLTDATRGHAHASTTTVTRISTALTREGTDQSKGTSSQPADEVPPDELVGRRAAIIVTRATEGGASDSESVAATPQAGTRSLGPSVSTSAIRREVTRGHALEAAAITTSAALPRYRQPTPATPAHPPSRPRTVQSSAPRGGSGLRRRFRHAFSILSLGFIPGVSLGASKLWRWRAAVEMVMPTDPTWIADQEHHIDSRMFVAHLRSLRAGSEAHPDSQVRDALGEPAGTWLLSAELPSRSELLSLARLALERDPSLVRFRKVRYSLTRRKDHEGAKSTLKDEVEVPVQPAAAAAADDEDEDEDEGEEDHHSASADTLDEFSASGESSGDDNMGASRRGRIRGMGSDRGRASFTLALHALFDRQGAARSGPNAQVEVAGALRSSAAPIIRDDPLSLAHRMDLELLIPVLQAAVAVKHTAATCIQRIARGMIARHYTNRIRRADLMALSAKHRRIRRAFNRLREATAQGPELRASRLAWWRLRCAVQTQRRRMQLFRCTFWPLYVWRRYTVQMIRAKSKARVLVRIWRTLQKMRHFRAWYNRACSPQGLLDPTTVRGAQLWHRLRIMRSAWIALLHIMRRRVRSGEAVVASTVLDDAPLVSPSADALAVTALSPSTPVGAPTDAPSPAAPHHNALLSPSSLLSRRERRIIATWLPLRAWKAVARTHRVARMLGRLLGYPSQLALVPGGARIAIPSLMQSSSAQDRSSIVRAAAMAASSLVRGDGMPIEVYFRTASHLRKLLGPDFVVPPGMQSMELLRGLVQPMLALRLADAVTAHQTTRDVQRLGREHRKHRLEVQRRAQQELLGGFDPADAETGIPSVSSPSSVEPTDIGSPSPSTAPDEGVASGEAVILATAVRLGSTLMADAIRRTRDEAVVTMIRLVTAGRSAFHEWVDFLMRSRRQALMDRIARRIEQRRVLVVWHRAAADSVAERLTTRELIARVKARAVAVKRAEEELANADGSEVDASSPRSMPSPRPVSSPRADDLAATTEAGPSSIAAAEDRPPHGRERSSAGSGSRAPKSDSQLPRSTSRRRRPRKQEVALTSPEVVAHTVRAEIAHEDVQQATEMLQETLQQSEEIASQLHAAREDMRAWLARVRANNIEDRESGIWQKRAKRLAGETDAMVDHQVRSMLQQERDRTRAILAAVHDRSTSLLAERARLLYEALARGFDWLEASRTRAWAKMCFASLRRPLLYRMAARRGAKAQLRNWLGICAALIRFDKHAHIYRRLRVKLGVFRALQRATAYTAQYATPGLIRQMRNRRAHILSLGKVLEPLTKDDAVRFLDSRAGIFQRWREYAAARRSRKLLVDRLRTMHQMRRLRLSFVALYHAAVTSRGDRRMAVMIETRTESSSETPVVQRPSRALVEVPLFRMNNVVWLPNELRWSFPAVLDRHWGEAVEEQMARGTATQPTLALQLALQQHAASVETPGGGGLLPATSLPLGGPDQPRAMAGAAVPIVILGSPMSSAERRAATDLDLLRKYALESCTSKRSHTEWLRQNMAFVERGRRRDAVRRGRRVQRAAIVPQLASQQVQSGLDAAADASHEALGLTLASRRAKRGMALRQRETITAASLWQMMLDGALSLADMADLLEAVIKRQAAVERRLMRLGLEQEPPALWTDVEPMGPAGLALPGADASSRTSEPLTAAVCPADEHIWAVVVTEGGVTGAISCIAMILGRGVNRLWDYLPPSGPSGSPAATIHPLVAECLAGLEEDTAMVRSRITSARESVETAIKGLETFRQQQLQRDKAAAATASSRDNADEAMRQATRGVHFDMDPTAMPPRWFGSASIGCLVRSSGFVGQSLPSSMLAALSSKGKDSWQWVRAVATEGRVPIEMSAPMDGRRGESKSESSHPLRIHQFILFRDERAVALLACATDDAILRVRVLTDRGRASPWYGRAEGGSLIVLGDVSAYLDALRAYANGRLPLCEMGPAHTLRAVGRLPRFLCGLFGRSTTLDGLVSLGVLTAKEPMRPALGNCWPERHIPAWQLAPSAFRSHAEAHVGASAERFIALVRARVAAITPAAPGRPSSSATPDRPATAESHRDQRGDATEETGDDDASRFDAGRPETWDDVRLLGMPSSQRRDLSRLARVVSIAADDAVRGDPSGALGRARGREVQAAASLPPPGQRERPGQGSQAARSTAPAAASRRSKPKLSKAASGGLVPEVPQSREQPVTQRVQQLPASERATSSPERRPRRSSSPQQPKARVARDEDLETTAVSQEAVVVSHVPFGRATHIHEATDAESVFSSGNEDDDRDAAEELRIVGRHLSTPFESLTRRPTQSQAARRETKDEDDRGSQPPGTVIVSGLEASRTPDQDSQDEADDLGDLAVDSSSSSSAAAAAAAAVPATTADEPATEADADLDNLLSAPAGAVKRRVARRHSIVPDASQALTQSRAATTSTTLSAEPPVPVLPSAEDSRRRRRASIASVASMHEEIDSFAQLANYELQRRCDALLTVCQGEAKAADFGLRASVLTRGEEIPGQPFEDTIRTLRALLTSVLAPPTGGEVRASVLAACGVDADGTLQAEAMATLAADVSTPTTRRPRAKDRGVKDANVPEPVPESQVQTWTDRLGSDVYREGKRARDVVWAILAPVEVGGLMAGVPRALERFHGLETRLAAVGVARWMLLAMLSGAPSEDEPDRPSERESQRQRRWLAILESIEAAQLVDLRHRANEAALIHLSGGSPRPVTVVSDGDSVHAAPAVGGATSTVVSMVTQLFGSHVAAAAMAAWEAASLAQARAPRRGTGRTSTSVTPPTTAGPLRVTSEGHTVARSLLQWSVSTSRRARAQYLRGLATSCSAANGLADVSELGDQSRAGRSVVEGRLRLVNAGEELREAALAATDLARAVRRLAVAVLPQFPSVGRWRRRVEDAYLATALQAAGPVAIEPNSGRGQSSAASQPTANAASGAASSALSATPGAMMVAELDARSFTTAWQEGGGPGCSRLAGPLTMSAGSSSSGGSTRPSIGEVHVSWAQRRRLVRALRRTPPWSLEPSDLAEVAVQLAMDRVRALRGRPKTATTDLQQAERSLSSTLSPMTWTLFTGEGPDSLAVTSSAPADRVRDRTAGESDEEDEAEEFEAHGLLVHRREEVPVDLAFRGLRDAFEKHQRSGVLRVLRE